MKWIVNITLLFFFIFFLSSVLKVTGQEPIINASIPLNDDEELYYKLKYGWFKVGAAKWSTQFKRYNKTDCYQFKLTAKSSGLLGVFAKIDDKWEEFTKKDDFLPLMTYRDIEEGKYLLDEKMYYDYNKQEITYKRIRKGEIKPTEYLKIDTPRVSLLGGFMKMRCVDYSRYNHGDRITIQAIFEKDLYTFDLIFAGLEYISSEVGELWAYKLIPDLPNNDLLPGKHPVTVWVSADQNKLPIKAEAKLYFGSAYVELVDYKNIKYGPNYRKN